MQVEVRSLLKGLSAVVEDLQLRPFFSRVERMAMLLSVSSLTEVMHSPAPTRTRGTQTSAGASQVPVQMWQRCRALCFAPTPQHRAGSPRPVMAPQARDFVPESSTAETVGDRPTAAPMPKVLPCAQQHPLVSGAPQSPPSPTRSSHATYATHAT